MDTENSCTCGRNIGEQITQEEKIHNALDSIFGKSEFVPLTAEEKEQIQARRETEKEMMVKYLTMHNQPIPESDKEIRNAYETHKYECMTQEEREKKHKQYMEAYNIMRIIRGFPGLAYDK